MEIASYLMAHIDRGYAGEPEEAALWYLDCTYQLLHHFFWLSTDPEAREEVMRDFQEALRDAESNPEEYFGWKPERPTFGEIAWPARFSFSELLLALRMELAERHSSDVIICWDEAYEQYHGIQDMVVHVDDREILNNLTELLRELRKGMLGLEIHPWIPVAFQKAINFLTSL